MALYADENFPLRTVEELRRLGHDVLTALEDGRANQSIPDEDLLARATEIGRTLTINRLDFKRLHRQMPDHAGIIICTEDRIAFDRRYVFPRLLPRRESREGGCSACIVQRERIEALQTDGPCSLKQFQSSQSDKLKFVGPKEFQPPRFLRGIEKSMIRKISDRAKPGSISLGLGEPDLPTPDVIVREAVRVIQEEKNGYTLQAGLPALRERIAGDYPHLNLSSDQVMVTAGSQEGLYLILRTLVEEGDEVLIPNPGFIAYPMITSMVGGRAVTYQLPARKDFSFDLDDFKQRISPRTKVVICISPSNPTGRALSKDDLCAMADAVKSSGSDAFIISDEIYRELYYTPERPASISEFYPRTIVVSGLSKSMRMTGWRIGWLAGEESVIKAALVLHGYVVTCASSISQKAALAAWTDEAGASRDEMRAIFLRRRDHLLDLLRNELGLRCVTPDGAFYTMVDVSNYGDELRVAEAGLEHGVVTIPATAFGSESKGYLRISFCAEEEKLSEGVRRLGEALKWLA